MGLLSFFAPPKPKAVPITWRERIVADDEWIGYIGDRWSGYELFHIKPETFTETGGTYCLHSKLSECVECFPALEDAQKRAVEQWESLVREGVKP